jgi:serine protease
MPSQQGGDRTKVRRSIHSGVTYVNHSSSLRMKLLVLATVAAMVPAAFAADAGRNGGARQGVSIEATQPGGEFTQFIIRYRQGSRELESATSMQGHLDQAAGMLGMRASYVREMALGAEVIRVDRALDADGARRFIGELSRNPAVEYVEVDALMQPLLTPNDPSYASQWHYFEALGGINVPAAWDISTGEGIVIAVIDTGVADHPDMQVNLVPGYDFISDADRARDGDGRDADPTDQGDWRAANQCGPNTSAANSSWHGTHVAGTVAADTDNGIGVAGVAFGGKVQHLRALGLCGGTISDIADAIVWAAGGVVTGVPANPTPAQVINLSLGGSGSCGPTYQAAMDLAHANGAVVVVAAGNSNTNVANARPANCDKVIAVGATDRNARRSSFSNYGLGIDLSAPGSGSPSIRSLGNSGTTVQATPNYVTKSGTSMAAPHVAGVAALVIAASEEPLSPDEVKEILVNTVKPFNATPNCTLYCGSGIVDAGYAVAVAAGDLPLPENPNPPPVPQPPPALVVLENGVPVTGLATSDWGDRTFSIEVPEGATNLRITMFGGTGDADLHTRFGVLPTTSVYDCRPYLNGNNEECVVAEPQAGTHYALVVTYLPYAGVTLVASYDVADPSPHDLAVVSSGARMRPLHTLSWTSGGDQVEIYRNGQIVHAGANTGRWSLQMVPASGPSTYQVCNAGSEDCSATVNIR